MPRRYNDFIGLIYETVQYPDGWQVLLNRLVEWLNARSGLLVLQNADNLDIADTVQTGFDESSRMIYNRDYRAHDIWTQALTHLPKGKVYATNALAPQAQFRQSLIYQEYCRPLGIEYGVGAFIDTGGPWSLRLAFQRECAQGEFRAGEVQLIQDLVPHLQRSIRIARELSITDGYLEAALEKLSAGCFLIDGRHKIVAMNSRAEKLLRDGTSELTSKQDHLTINSAKFGNQLDSLVRDAYETATRGSGNGGGEISLPRRNGPPLILSIMPFTQPTRITLRRYDGLVAIFVYDPDNKSLPSRRRLQAAFDLTPSEVAVAIELVKGRGNQEIASALGKSIHTVKSHLKSVYAKTGTHRQSELVTLLQSCTLPTD